MAKRKKTSRRDEHEEDVVRTVRSSESYLSMGLGLLVVVVVGVMIFNFVSRRNGGLSLPGLQTSKQNEAPTKAPEQKKYKVVEGDTLWSISEKNYNTGFNWKAIADANKITAPDQLTAGKELIIPKMEDTKVVASVSTTPTTVPSVKPSTVPSITPTKVPSVTPSAVPTKQPTPMPTKAPTQVVKPTTVAQITQPVAQPTQAPVATIKGEEYTIVAGDNLWTIAERAYGDGYKWTEIAKANNLANPDLIFTGNKLKLPRSK